MEPSHQRGYKVYEDRPSSSQGFEGTGVERQVISPVIVFSPKEPIFSATMTSDNVVPLTMCKTYDWATIVVNNESPIGNQSKRLFEPSVSLLDAAEEFTISTPGADLTWLAEFYESAIDAQSAPDIYPLVSGIAEMFRQKDYISVDNILCTAPLNSMSVTAMVTLVRTTYPARNKLTQWSKSLCSIREKLHSNGENAAALLRGLA